MGATPFDMYLMAPAAGASAGGLAGSMLGGGGGSASIPKLGYSTPAFINQMNSMLDTALTQAIQTSTGYTQQAIKELRASNKDALSSLTNYLSLATDAANKQSQQGFAQAQALQTPYRNAGYAGMDKYLDTLGIARPKVGGQAVADSLVSAQKIAELMGQYKNQIPTNPGDAPLRDAYGNVKKPTLQQFLPTTQQINKTIRNNLAQTPYGFEYRGPGYIPTDFTFGTGLPIKHPGISLNVQDILNSPEIRTSVANALAQPKYKPALQAYNTSQSNYDKALSEYNAKLAPYQQFGNSLNQSQITPEQLKIALAANPGLFGPPR